MKDLLRFFDDTFKGGTPVSSHNAERKERKQKHVALVRQYTRLGLNSPQIAQRIGLSPSYVRKLRIQVRNGQL